MPDNGDKGPLYEQQDHSYWIGVLIEAFQNAWKDVIANKLITFIAAIIVLFGGAGVHGLRFGWQEGLASMQSVVSGLVATGAVMFLFWIYHVLRIPPQRATSQKAEIEDLRSRLSENVGEPALRIECGEVQVRQTELLFRVRVSASNGESIEQLECHIYDATSLASDDLLLLNKLRSMRGRPLERMHFYKKCQITHRVAAGDTADYDLIYQRILTGDWMMRFALDYLYEDPIPHGRYRFAVRARADGFKDAIGHFDAWEGNDGRLCFNEAGNEISLGVDIVAAIDRQADGESPALPQPKNSATDHEAEMRELERETAIIKQNAALHEAARNFEALMRSRADRQ